MNLQNLLQTIPACLTANLPAHEALELVVPHAACTNPTSCIAWIVEGSPEYAIRVSATVVQAIGRG